MRKSVALLASPLPAGIFPAAPDCRLLRVEVNDVDPHTCFTSHSPKIMQMGAPLAILFQIVSHMLGQKNVSGISAIHHPLRHVDSRARNIGTFVHVGNTVHRSAVDSHPHPQLRVAPQCLTDFQRTGNRCVRRGRKNQRHPIASGQAHQLTSSFGCAE